MFVSLNVHAENKRFQAASTSESMEESTSWETTCIMMYTFFPETPAQYEAYYKSAGIDLWVVISAKGGQNTPIFLASSPFQGSFS